MDGFSAEILTAAELTQQGQNSKYRYDRQGCRPTTRLPVLAFTEGALAIYKGDRKISPRSALVELLQARLDRTRPGIAGQPHIGHKNQLDEIRVRMKNITAYAENHVMELFQTGSIMISSVHNTFFLVNDTSGVRKTDGNNDATYCDTIWS